MNEYIECLERESAYMADMLQRMARRIGELTEQRNKLWRENVELKRPNYDAEGGEA